jgi:hypothetical protein
MANRAKKRSREDGQGFLRGALIDVEKQFKVELRTIARNSTHDGSLGDGVEDAWIRLLRRYLPERYCVDRAFAIDHQGTTTDQLDCVIYDSHFTPSLFGRDRNRYVPAEAVYATFEIKPTVNAQHLKAAAKKVGSVRKLLRTSAPIPWANGVNPAKKPFLIIGGILAMKASWANGLGQAFERQFRSWDGNYQLDMVLTASSGFCDRFSPGCLTTSNGAGTLIRGLFRLLSALRDRATVTAIDWGKYECVLTSQAGNDSVKVRRRRLSNSRKAVVK